MTLLDALRRSLALTEDRRRRAGVAPNRASAASMVSTVRRSRTGAQAAADDHHWGLEIYCQQLVAILDAAPRLPVPGSAGPVVEFPARTIDHISNDLAYLLSLRRAA